MHTRTVGLLLCVLLATSTLVGSRQTADERTGWNRPFEPFKVIGNINYVGAAGVSAFLIATEAGSILLDGGLPETAPQIVRNLEALGFKIADVKYLLNSHAHFDHAGGLAELQRLSKATIAASARDADSLKAGSPDMPAVTVGRLVKDGETLKLGSTTMTAHITPGHTKGCTTWTMTTTDGGRPYDVVFYCSTSVVDRLVGNSRYPEIVSDYEHTFAAMRTFRADVFLGPHPVFFRMAEKRKRMSAGGPNPFVDPSELGRFVEESERQFRIELKKQQSERF